jgi:CheY-like chemotaxis protein
MGATRKPATAKRSRSASDVVENALAAFAHEVRTPLTGIHAVSDLLATSELGERERRWVETIKASAEHLAGLTTLFVDAARSRNAGKGDAFVVREDFFDLRALARSIGDSLAGRAAAKGLQSDVRIVDALPTFVIGDAVRLRAALENLIDNAVKFTAEGDVALKVTTQRAPKGRARIAFAMSDSGIGLTLAEIKRLFRPFSQANVSIASRFGGAGLGLSSVRQLAKAMGGDVAVAQRRGGGATFTLTVELALAEGSAAQGAVAEDATSAEPARALRVLSVEDNPFGRVVLNAILTELGHHAEFVGHGELASDRVAQGDFDVVLMDMVLPGINGVEAIRRIRALPGPQRRIAVIGLSGRGDDEAPARAAGADAFLLKPVSPRALATALLAARRRVTFSPS